VHERAYAKVNLALDVVGKRSDGYHDLRSVMQTISLHDSLIFSLDPNFAGLQQGTGSPEDTELRDILDGREDFSLIDRAIDLIRMHVGFAPAVYYRLTKRIPVAAGLGGGSSDAVAALLGTSRLLGTPVEPSIMAELAATLGSDTPFFLTGGTALVEGRGERVTPLERMPQRWLVLANMNVPVSTATVFSRWHEEQRGDGHSVDRVLVGLRANRVALGGNDLSVAATEAFPSIAEAKRLLLSVAPKDNVGMAGSGGTMFALFDDEAEAIAAHEVVSPKAPWSLVAHSCAGGAI
jgi:4-diphosphocytidyl-2-C-methyl-D-erythritol kinase